MSAHHRNSPAILGAFVLLLCLGTDLAAQSPYAPATAGDSVQQQPQSLIRKFTFKHGKAADVLKILQQLAGPTDHIGLKIAVDERTNSLVFQPEDDRQSRYFEETCTLLDAETPAPGDTGNGLSISIPALGPHPLAFDFSIGIERGESLESLKQRYNELEQQAHLLADKLKQSTSLSDSQRTELQLAVRKSFEARQTLQRAELADLAQRMQSMQQSIDMRDKLADKVVERRVEDLLNPNLKWDAGKVSEQILAAPNQSSSNPAMPLPPSPSPASVSARYVPGEPTATVIRKRIQGRWTVQTYSDGNKDALPDSAGQVEVEIEGNLMRYLVGKQDTTGPILLAASKDVVSPTLTEEDPLPIDFIYDPNGDPQIVRGIIACDGTTLSICMASYEGRANKDFRPSLFVPGTKVTLIKCRRAEPENTKAVSVDHAIWKAQVQHATSKLLAAFPVPPAIDQNDAPKVIAIVDVDYQGKQDASNLQEEIFKWIAADIPFARVQGSYASLSRSAVKLAMQETGLRPRDLTRSNPYYIDNRQKLLKQLRSHELKVDALLITSLKHLENVEDAYPRQFEIAMEGFVDARTTNWIERVNIDGKAKGRSSELLGNSLPQFDTPQALLARVDECSNNGSYEEFVTLFSNDGVRDLAGSLIVSAMQVTTMTDLAKQNGGDLGQGPARIQEALNRWLKPNPTPEQQQAASEALSLMFAIGFGGSIQDKSVITTYVAGVRKNAERVSDLRKFSVDMLKAYHELTGEPFGYFNKEKDREWQVTLTGDKAVATLVIKTKPTPATVGFGSNKAEQSLISNGSEQLPVMTLTNLDGTWRISSLFDELLNVVQPNIEAPSAAAPDQSNSKMITRRYSVGSFVTESFFTGKGNYDLKEIYEKYENEIEQSLQDLAKTVTATCTQPPKFVQVLSGSRCLLIGHTEAGHLEIADFMSDIGISNDRIRLRGVEIEITKDEAMSLGIELTQDLQLLSSEKAEQLRTFQKNKKSESEKSSRDFSFVAMDEAIQSGTRTHVKSSEVGLQFPFAARIVPGTKKVQVRMDFHSASGGVEIFSPRIQSLSDAQSVLFVFGDDFYWLATAEIVQDAIVGSERNDKTASNPLPPSTPALEMQQRLQGEWDVKVMGISADVSDKRPYQAVVRGQLFLLQCMEDGKVIGTSTWKMIWPEADHPDVVDIVWDPNNNSDEHFCPGRIACVGKSFQVAWRSDDSISGPAIRPTEICSGEGISYFECVRKQPADQSPTSTSSDAPVGPKYSGHPLSWWLDSYWDNATAIPKTAENAAQEFVASEAIRQLREKSECEAVIEAALAKWFASVEHEVNEGQLTRAAKCIVTVAGPAHQETAVKLLFKIWKRMPLLTYAEQGEMADDDTELNQLLSQLVLNEQLAAQFADRLTNGDSSDRSLVLYGLLSLMGRFGVETNKDLTELENWLRKHAERLAPAVEAASHDANEQIRFTSLIQLATLIHATKLDPELVRLPKVLLTAASDAAPNVRYIAIELLTSNELAPSVKSQNIELSPILVKTLESDTSIDVRYSALGALMKLDAASEVVHATLLEWARGKERLQVEYALSLMLRNHAAGDRPQSIDELIELLSDPEWGTKVEVNYNNWSTHHRWARQYAFAILGQYAAHGHRAIPTLEAELARNNTDTLSFATAALDRVRGYCPDLPIDKLQGEWEFVSIQKPEGSSPFFDFQTSPEQQPSSSVTISGTQLKLSGRVLAELSHYRSGSRQGVALLLDPDGKKRHCHGGYNFKSSPSPEDKPNVAPAPELLIVEVVELLNNRDATQTTKQIYEFRRISK